jgi:hypothetical protein
MRRSEPRRPGYYAGPPKDCVCIDKPAIRPSQAILLPKDGRALGVEKGVNPMTGRRSSGIVWA